ncbi:hypothetical protein FGRA07_11770 [Fusarium graminearum]|uniref:Uncharacterized protein n=1 Tax=Gibberella zeae TaxID=5518 RepID=A0A2H3G5J9_GIBZA|nr:hypothetical protein FGRA07_11770 [Fusarium graminearum]
MTKIMIPVEQVQRYVDNNVITEEEIKFRGHVRDLDNKPKDFPGHIEIAVVEMSNEEISARLKARGLDEKEVGSLDAILIHELAKPIRATLDFLGLGWWYKQ